MKTRRAVFITSNGTELKKEPSVLGYDVVCTDDSHTCSEWTSLTINLRSSNPRPCGQDCSVGIATRYGLDGPGIESRWEARFSAPVQTGLGAHPASCKKGTGSFPGVNRPGRGADPPPVLQCRGLKLSGAIPLPALRALVAHKG